MRATMPQRKPGDGTPPFVDPGNAPEFFANGLHSVEVMGAVSRFVLFVVRSLPDGRKVHEPPFTCIMPNDAIGPAIALTLQTLPSGLIVPAVGVVAKSLLFH